MGYIGGIEKHKVKIGFKGIMGNKGSTIILFKVKDTIIVAANCHLSSGVGHLNSRLSEVRLIESKLGKLV